MKTFREWLIAEDLGDLQQYTVHSQGFKEKPAIHHNIEADSVHIRSINSLKEVIKGQTPEQAKLMVTRDIMSAVGKVTAQGIQELNQS